jgi:hypothetical protein
MSRSSGGHATPKIHHAGPEVECAASHHPTIPRRIGRDGRHRPALPTRGGQVLRRAAEEDPIEGGGATDGGEAQAANASRLAEEFPEVDANDLPVARWAVGAFPGERALLGSILAGVVVRREAIGVAIEPGASFPGL